MSHQSHCLVLSLVFLSFLNPLQSGSGIVFPQSQQSATKQSTTQQTGGKKTDKQSQTQQTPPAKGDPAQTDILKQYPHVPPPTPTTQNDNQEQPDKVKTGFGQKLPAGSEVKFSY